MRRPELGQWCDLRGTAVKTRRAVHYSRRIVEWVYSTIPQGKTIRGMYIGKRIVMNGTWHDYGDEESRFTRGKSHEVWLFVLGEHRNPVYVFPDQVKD